MDVEREDHYNKNLLECRGERYKESSNSFNDPFFENVAMLSRKDSNHGSCSFLGIIKMCILKVCLNR